MTAARPIAVSGSTISVLMNRRDGRTPQI
jgi:hypothetical protein